MRSSLRYDCLAKSDHSEAESSEEEYQSGSWAEERVNEMSRKAVEFGKDHFDCKGWDGMLQEVEKLKVGTRVSLEELTA